MKISDVIYRLCRTRLKTQNQKDKLCAIFLLENEMLEIFAKTQDPMAALLRQTWHREQITKKGNNSHKHLKLITKYHEEFAPYLEQFFTAWEIAFERRSKLSADDLINHFIIPRTQIYNVILPTLPELMTIFYIHTLIYNLPFFITHGWQIFSPHAAQQTDTLINNVHNLLIQCDDTKYSKAEKIIFNANHYLFKRLTSGKTDISKATNINLGLLQLHLILKTL